MREMFPFYSYCICSFETLKFNGHLPIGAGFLSLPFAALYAYSKHFMFRYDELKELACFRY